MVLVPKTHSPLGFPWGQQRNPPWRGRGLSRCHLECWLDANCSQRMMSLRDSQCQTHPWLRMQRDMKNSRCSVIAKHQTPEKDRVSDFTFTRQWNLDLTWLISFPPICSSPIPVIWSSNGSKVGEWNRIMVVCWRGAWQAAWVRGMRRLAGWCWMIY